MPSVRDRIRAASNAEGEALWQAIKVQHPEALENATLNRNLTEEMALYIARNKNVRSETLGHLSQDVRFGDSYKLKLALAKNPKTPQRITLSLLKFIRLFDLADITRNKFIPVAIRQKVEFMLSERISAMPSGVRMAMAKRACASLVSRIMERSDRKVVNACLESPLMTEEEVRKLVLLPRTKALIIQAIAAHQKWSLRHPIRYALVRNSHSPMSAVEKYIEEFTTPKLQELYVDRGVPSGTRPFIHAELQRRGAPLELEEHTVYELRGDEDEALEDRDEAFESEDSEHGDSATNE